MCYKFPKILNKNQILTIIILAFFCQASCQKQLFLCSQKLAALTHTHCRESFFKFSAKLQIESIFISSSLDSPIEHRKCDVPTALASLSLARSLSLALSLCFGSSKALTTFEYLCSP